MSADWADKPEAVPYSDLADPQSLNLYTYVRNNPVSRTDKDGHCFEGVDTWVCWAAGAIVASGVAMAVHHFVGALKQERDAVNRFVSHTNEMIDASDHGDPKTAQDKDDQRQQDERDAYNAAGRAAAAASTLPGTSTGGDPGVGVGDAVATLVEAGLDAANSRAEKKQSEQQKKTHGKEDGQTDSQRPKQQRPVNSTAPVEPAPKAPKKVPGG